MQRNLEAVVQIKKDPIYNSLQIFREGSQIHNMPNFLGHNHSAMQRIWDAPSKKKEREGIRWAF